MIFDKCFDILIKHEGEYVNDTRDPGGETKFGISKRVYPNLDIKNLTIDQAKYIYKRDYWDECKCNELPEKIALHVFDMAVNSGNSKAIKDLQKCLNIVVDGICGEQTILFCKQANEEFLIAKYCKSRIDFMKSLKTWSIYKKGWVKRIMNNIKETHNINEYGLIRSLYIELEKLIK